MAPIERLVMSTPKIRVLIVDDSAVVRQTLSEVLSSDPEIEVIATAADPFVAAERIREQTPDVITWISRCRAWMG
jgi:two-component system, chemotaxis family, protein-glutamate methylesterase/glutaminase